MPWIESPSPGDKSTKAMNVHTFGSPQHIGNLGSQGSVLCSVFCSVLATVRCVGFSCGSLGCASKILQKSRGGRYSTFAKVLEPLFKLLDSCILNSKGGVGEIHTCSNTIPVSLFTSSSAALNFLWSSAVEFASLEAPLPIDLTFPPKKKGKLVKLS